MGTFNDFLKNKVFSISLLITVALVLFGMVAPEVFKSSTGSAFKFLITNFSWLYLISMFVFVVFSIFLGMSKFGDIKLGADDSVPEYKTLSWFAMLFGAGMGIGLVFWGVAEPLNHYASFGNKETAMVKSFLHWGFHPWAGYAIAGMALAYFQFRKNAPGLISSIFLPILGEEGIKGPIGKLIDISAVFATVAGVATSLGSGTMQIASGLNYVFKIPLEGVLLLGIPKDLGIYFLIIVFMAVLYTWSAVKGISKGIKLLSDINMLLVGILMIGCFLVGPKLLGINIFTNTLGIYINNIIENSLAINPFGNNKWLGSWTIFYWAWWIAWAPFVGTFIARISKGRTIREFVVGVIVAPSLGSFVWFSIFGSMGLNLSDGIIYEAIQKTETALFVVLNQYPLGALLSVVAILLLVTFFVTSANSATFVLSMFSSHGDLNPSSGKKTLWGILQAALAMVLLATGGLEALQTCSIVAAFPFCIIMLLACFCLFKALQTDKKTKPISSKAK